MKKVIETRITINATIDQVWSVFSDFKKYPEWNPFVQKLEGDVKIGSTIFIQLPGMKFKPVVLEYTLNKALRWKGKFFLKGLFDGEHYFTFKKIDEHNVEIVHGEKFSGALVRFFQKKIDNETRNGFIEMNNALKNRVEAL